MSQKRRDKKRRILRNGESVRPDGRYAYKYIDANGKQKFVYSWKLEPTDEVPKGKKDDGLCLREKERKIQKDLHDGIVVNGGGMTVLQLVEKYVLLKTGVRENTRAGYKTVINILKREEFGGVRIDRVKQLDAMTWLVKLQQEDNRSYSSIHSIRGVLRPAFQLAVDNDYIRKNPFDFQLATVLVNDSVTREAITRKEEKAFLDFVKNDKHYSKYYEGIYILFNTGLRIGEFVGLTIGDIDFKNNLIHVNHQMQRKRDGTYYIEEPKTKAGVRAVPMSDEVSMCFRKIIHNRNQNRPLQEPIIDGYGGFLYFDKFGKPLVAQHWEKYFQHICEKYNKTYKNQLPKITPHVCRHTYCSNMAKSGMNPKVLQDIMGHSDISVTLNTYTHLNVQDKIDEFARVTKANSKRVVNADF